MAESDPPSATLGWIAAQPRAFVLITCSGEYDKAAPCPVHRIEAAEAVARWGAATTLRDLERRLICTRCGAAGKAEALFLTGPSILMS